MKIAVAYENGEVLERLCDVKQFKIYKTDGERISSCDVISARHGISRVTDFLSAKTVDVLICGEISEEVKQRLSELRIEICQDVRGNCDAVVSAYLTQKEAYNILSQRGS